MLCHLPSILQKHAQVPCSKLLLTENLRVQMLQQLTPNVYLKLFHSVNPTAHLLECVRYLHPQHHTLLLEAQFRDELLACRLELPDMAQEADDYIEVCSCCIMNSTISSHDSRR